MERSYDKKIQICICTSEGEKRLMMDNVTSRY